MLIAVMLTMFTVLVYQASMLLTFGWRAKIREKIRFRTDEDAE